MPSVRRYLIGACAIGFALLVADAGPSARQPDASQIRAVLARLKIVPRLGDRVYTITAQSMEATLRCSRPEIGCTGAESDRVLGRPYSTGKHPARDDLIAFRIPRHASTQCGAPVGSTFIKRVVGMPGDRVTIRQINGSTARVVVAGRDFGRRYHEGYIGDKEAFRVPRGRYFVVGDNPSMSCDSHVFGAVLERNVVTKIVAIYWPPERARRLA